jgi:hypothetical protein
MRTDIAGNLVTPAADKAKEILRASSSGLQVLLTRRSYLPAMKSANMMP